MTTDPNGLPAADGPDMLVSNCQAYEGNPDPDEVIEIEPVDSRVVPCAECVYAKHWTSILDAPSHGVCTKESPGVQYNRFPTEAVPVGIHYTGWPQIGHDEGCGAGVRRNP